MKHLEVSILFKVPKFSFKPQGFPHNDNPSEKSQMTQKSTTAIGTSWHKHALKVWEFTRIRWAYIFYDILDDWKNEMKNDGVDHDYLEIMLWFERQSNG